MRTNSLLLMGLMAIMLSGCRVNRPDDVLTPKRMEQFLYDYHLAQSITQELPREERYTTPAYIEWAYHKHGITKSEFDRSLVWYTRYPKEFAKIYKRLSLTVEREYNAAGKILSQIEKKSFVIQSGDSVSLWYLNHTALMNSSQFMDRITFQINRDTTFHKGDTLRWSMYGTFIGIDSGVPQSAYIAMSAYYGDSVSTTDTIVYSNGSVELSLMLDNELNMTSLSGSINYMDSTQNRESMLVLSNVDLMRYHVRQGADSTKVTDSAHLPAEL